MKLSTFWCGLLCLPLVLAVGCRSSRSGEASDSNSPGTAQWQGQPLTIDGSDRDWVKPLPGFQRTDNISYSVSNDGQNLYILVSTKSPQEQQKIIQGGMSVWVNTKGDKNNNADAVGIGYPLDEHSDPDRKLMEEAQPQRYNKKPVTLEDKKSYALYGFNKDSIPDYVYGSDNPQGVVMRMDYNNAGELIYELAIPLKTLYPQHNTSSSYAANSVAVGIFIEGLPPSAHVPREGGGGPGIGVGGGIGTGGFGSGVGLGLSVGTGMLGGGRRNNKQLFDQTQIWHVAQLAKR
jgi:hypothetical protein